MAGTANKDFAISVSAQLNQHTTDAMRKQLKNTLKDEIVKINPQINASDLKKQLDRAIKDAFRSGSYKVDSNGLISQMMAQIQTAPGISTQVALQYAKSYIDKETGRRVPSKWDVNGSVTSFTKNANLKVYEQMNKEMANIVKLMGQAEIKGNKVGLKQLKKDFAYMQKNANKMWEQISPDYSTKQQSNIQTRMQKILEKAYIGNDNQKMASSAQMIKSYASEIQKLKIQQLDMGKGTKAWEETNKEIEKNQRAVRKLVGDNQELNKVKDEQYRIVNRNVKNAQSVDDLTRYTNASKNSLKYEKEIASIRDKIKKDSTLNTKETQTYLKNLTAENKIQKDIMETVKKRSAGKMTEQGVADAEKDYLSQLRLIQTRTASISSKTKNFFKDISTGWKDAAARVVDYTIAYRTLWGGIALIQDGIATIYTLNKAFTDIQMVTGYTNEQVTKLASTYGTLAKNMGATIEQVAQGATEWLRQGKSVEETNELLKQSMIMSKVGAMESAEATEYLTSTLNGYKMSVEDASKIVDVFSALDMSAATSTKELAQAFQRSANSAKDAGIPFEQLAEYITIVSETTRKSASTIGESFKTLSARYMNVKLGKVLDGETGEQLNDVEKALSTVGIRIRTDENTWRDFGDVIEEVGGKWKTYNDLQKNTIVTAMAGVRQAENLRALFNNFDKVAKYEDVVSGASGSSMEKYDTYLNSLEAKQNKMLSTWQSIAYQPAFEETLKSVVDLGTGIGGLIGKIGLLGTTLASIGMVASLSGSKLSILKSNVGETYRNFGIFNPIALKTLKTLKGFDNVKFDNVISGSDKGVGFLSNFKVLNAYASALGTQTMPSFIKSMVASTAKTVAMTVATTALNMAIGGLIGFGLTWLGMGIAKAIDEQIVTIEEQRQKVDELSQSIQTLSSEYDSLLSKENKTPADLQKLKLLQAEITAKKELLRLDQQALYDKEAKADKKFKNVGLDKDRTIQVTSTRTNIDKYNGIGDETKAKSLDDYNKIVQEKAKMIKVLAEEAKKLQDYKDAGVKISAVDEQRLKEMYGIINTYDATIGKTEDVTQATDEFGNVIEDTTDAMASEEDQAKDLSDSLSGLAGLHDEIRNAQEEYNDQGFISADTIASLIKSYPELTSVLTRYQLGLASISDVMAGLQGQYDADLEAYKTQVKEKMQYDEGFYSQILTNNAQAVADFADKYGWDLRNFKTLAEAKLAVEGNLISALSTLWNDYFNVQTGTLTQKGEELKQQMLWASKYEGTDSAHYKDLESKYNQFMPLVNEYVHLTQDFDKATANFDVPMNTKADAAAKEKKDKEKKDVLEAYNKNKKILDSDISLSKSRAELYEEGSEEWAKEQKVQYDLYVKIQNLAHNEAQRLRKLGYKETSEEIMQLKQDYMNAATDMMDFAKKAKEMIKSFKEGQLDEVQWKIDDLENEKANDSRIKDLEDEIEAKKKLLEEEEYSAEVEAEKTAEIQKQKDLIESLKKQKDVRVFRGDKGWVWESDQSKINDEEKTLKDLEKDYKDWQLNKEINDLEDELDTIVKSYDDQIEALQKVLDNQQYQLDKAERKTTMTFNTLVDNLNAFGQGSGAVFSDLLEWVNKLREEMGLDPIDFPSAYGGNQITVGSSGNAPSGTPVGTIVHTGGGDFQVVAPGTPGASYNPANGLYSIKLPSSSGGSGGSGGGTGSGGGSSSNAQRTINVGSSGNAPSGTANGTIVHTAGGDFKVVPKGTPGSSYNPKNGLSSVKVNDEGGLNTGKGMMLKDVVEPERVLSPVQTKSFEKLVRYLPRLVPALDVVGTTSKGQFLNNINNEDDSIIIDKLYITAPNNATLQSLLSEAKNIAKINKR